MSDANKPLYDFASHAIRYCFLANAGAIVALLAFLGQMWASTSVQPPPIETDPAIMHAALRWFVAGLVCAIVAAAFCYVVLQIRAFQVTPPQSALGRWWPPVVFLIWMAGSSGSFVIGAFSASGVLVDRALGCSSQYPAKQYPRGQYPQGQYPNDCSQPDGEQPDG